MKTDFMKIHEKAQNVKLFLYGFAIEHWINYTGISIHLIIYINLEKADAPKGWKGNVLVI